MAASPGACLRRLLHDRRRRRARGRSASDPNVIYAGTGETCIRNNVSHGDGVYKSDRRRQDLDEHRPARHPPHRATSSIHPTNPDLVYVAALGHALGPNEERGVFRSNDGGRSWEKVLFKSERAGSHDLAHGPDQPAHPLRARLAGAALPARADQRRRGVRPLAVDRRRRHLGRDHPQPRAAEGRAGQDRRRRLACPGGRGWGASGRWSRPRTARCSARTTAARPGAGSARTRRCAPAPGTTCTSPPTRTTPTPSTFRTTGCGNRSTAARPSCRSRRRTATTTPSGSIRNNRRRMIEGNDGGACVSFNGGAVLVDDLQPADRPALPRHHRQPVPYRVYGSQQDNTAISMPSASPTAPSTSATGIGRAAARAATSRSSRTTPTMSWPPARSAPALHQRHHDLLRPPTQPGLADITVWPELYGWGVGAETLKYRFQWTFPIHFSPHDPDVLYVAGNIVYRSTDEGTSWEVSART